MSVKTRFIRFALFFMIYLSINLLIAKLRSNGILRISKINLRKNKYGIVEETSNTKNSFIVKENSFYYIEKEQKEKIAKQILETCKENNLTTSMVKMNFAYSPEHRGLYCWIRKAGSASFIKLFLNANNHMDAYGDYRTLKLLSPKNEKFLENLIQDPNIFKLLVVRHPFERLVYAYRDRIEDTSKYTAESYVYVPKIFNLTRPELFKSEPVDYSLIKIFNEDKRLKLVPTFSEFVQWILQQESEKDDPYWNQYYKHCALCSVHYNHVLKLDNYTNNEINYIFKQMNLVKTEISLLKLKQTQGHTNFDVTCNYFKNLTHEAVVNLYEKYKIDFDMFNYEFDKYFECTDGD